ncbi:MAG: class I SAM-dependent methyltransferase [Caldilineales bacterium]|nr:class I SAM-dependent methyltransferase [Caldilineales bacterium]
MHTLTSTVTLYASKILHKLTTLVVSTDARLEGWLGGQGDASLARKLKGESQVRLSVNYAAGNYEVWAKHLAGFQGKAGVRMLEIGSFEGASAVWFLDNILTHPAARLTCIDTFSRQRGEPHFDHNMRASGHATKVTKIKARSDEVLPGMELASFDIIYIDGDHRAQGVLMDAVACWLLLKPNGVLIFDDYLWGDSLPPIQRPQMAVDLFLAAFAPQLEVLAKDYQALVRKLPTKSDDGR